LTKEFAKMVVLDTGGGASALGAIGNVLASMLPVMTGAALAQIQMSLVMAVLNVAKTAASDVEDASKKS
jgi:hypothetical protein